MPVKATRSVTPSRRMPSKPTRRTVNGVNRVRISSPTIRLPDQPLYASVATMLRSNRFHRGAERELFWIPMGTSLRVSRHWKAS